MEYKRFGQKIILRLNPGEEVTECIREVCRTEKVALGEVSGLGAACEVELGVFDTTQKKYYGKSFKGIYEIASLTGNITQQGENPISSSAHGNRQPAGWRVPWRPFEQGGYQRHRRDFYYGD